MQRQHATMTVQTNGVRNEQRYRECYNSILGIYGCSERRCPSRTSYNNEWRHLFRLTGLERKAGHHKYEIPSPVQATILGENNGDLVAPTLFKV